MPVAFDALVLAPVGAVGTGPITLPLSALAGYFLPSSENIGKQMYYVIHYGDQREVGKGTLGFSELQFTISRGLIKSTTGSLLNVTTSATIAVGDIAPEALEIVNIYDAAENAVTVDQATIGGVRYPQRNGRSGLRLSRVNSDELQISAGWIWDNVGATIDVESAITLDLAESGDFVNSSTRATTTWYHVLIGRAGGVIVAGLSTTLDKPAAWDSWQQIGAYVTDATGGGEWLNDIEQSGDWFSNGLLNSTMFNNTSPSTTKHTLRAWCPPGSYLAKICGRLENPSGSTFANIYNGAGLTVLNRQPRLLASGVQNPEYELMTDGSGQIAMQLSDAVTFTRCQWFGMGYRYPIGEAL